MDLTLLSEPDLRLIAAVQRGLPLTSRPYRDIGRRIGMDESEVIAAVRRLLELRVINRLGVVVRHHELGYTANAMVAWDIPDDQVAEVGRCMGSFEFVTLCYRRERRPPAWPYNLYCMVHGREREAVMAQVDHLARACGLDEMPRAVLFSGRRFKQRGAVYRDDPDRESAA